MLDGALYGVALHLLAADPADPLSLGLLAQYGLLGFVAAGAIVFGRVSYKREITRADRLEAEVTRLNNLIIDRALPALTAAASAAEQQTAVVRDMQQELSVLRRRRRSTGGEG